MNAHLNIRIEIDGGEPNANSQRLRKLGAELERELDACCSYDTIKSPDDTQAGDLATTVQIVGVAIPALALLWSIVKIRFRSSITIEKILPDGTKVTMVKNLLSDKQFEEFRKQVESEAAQNIIIRTDNSDIEVFKNK